MWVLVPPFFALIKKSTQNSLNAAYFHTKLLAGVLAVHQSPSSELYQYHPAGQLPTGARLKSRVSSFCVDVRLQIPATDFY